MHVAARWMCRVDDEITECDIAGSVRAADFVAFRPTKSRSRASSSAGPVAGRRTSSAHQVGPTATGPPSETTATIGVALDEASKGTGCVPVPDRCARRRTALGSQSRFGTNLARIQGRHPRKGA